jgi:hypothetical protein
VRRRRRSSCCWTARCTRNNTYFGVDATAKDAAANETDADDDDDFETMTTLTTTLTAPTITAEAVYAWKRD